MKTLRFLLSILVICLVSACTKDFQEDNLSQSTDNTDNEFKCKPLQLKIAVISDIHYLHPSLLRNGATKGEAFQNYLLADPKLIEFSGPIFKKVIWELRFERPDIVLIPGDLTKDGELMSHTAMAGMLQQLVREGIKVYVIPGNHDINNPEAVAYDGNIASPTPTITAEEFKTIYNNFGYRNALYKDPSSLSYISQPYKDLWILGIDDCKYYNNTTFAIVSGRIKPETMSWITSKMKEANERNITVLAMMHHGILQHYTGQNQLDPGYVTDDWETNAEALMNAGLKVMFTGHYHANDISMRSSDGNILYDIETGSLVTPPSPYRMITFNGKNLDISTNRVYTINRPMPGGLSFTAYSRQFLVAHLDGIFTYILSNPPYSLPDALTTFAAPLFRNAMMAHYAGDERISPWEQAKDNELGTIAPELGDALMGIWTDLPPKDNKWQINLK